jgi:peptidoglycan/LPS O-acetylase OafA/YrhL
VLASLGYFNRDSDWDAWAPYFMYAYGLGALAWWLGASSRAAIGTVLILAVVVAALMVAFRWHVLVATLLALLLGVTARAAPWQARVAPVWIRYLARISYAVFLVHFPVYVVVSAAFTHFVPHTPWVSALGMFTVWLTSLGVGALFHTQVEQRLGRWMARPRATPLAQPVP